MRGRAGAGADRPQRYPQRVPQVLQQTFLVEPNLGRGAQVLQAAAAAHSGVGAARYHSLRGRTQHLADHTRVEAAVAGAAAERHPLTGEGTVDEHLLARDPGDAAAIVSDGFYVGLDGVCWQYSSTA